VGRGCVHERRVGAQPFRMYVDPEAKVWQGSVEQGPRVGHCQVWNAGRHDEEEKEAK
jgi:hypothetical protein